MGRNTQAIAPARRPSRAAPGPGTRRDGRSQAAISMRMLTASGAAISSMANEMTSAHTGSICTGSTRQPMQIEEANIRSAAPRPVRDIPNAITHRRDGRPSGRLTPRSRCRRCNQPRVCSPRIPRALTVSVTLNTARHAELREPNREPTVTGSGRRHATSLDHRCSWKTRQSTRGDVLR